MCRPSSVERPGRGASYRHDDPGGPRSTGRPEGSGVDALAVEAGCTLDDEVLAGGDVVAHQQVEHALGGGGVRGADPAQGAVAWIHGGLRELIGVHLAEALVPLDRLLV